MDYHPTPVKWTERTDIYAPVKTLPSTTGSLFAIGKNENEGKHVQFVSAIQNMPIHLSNCRYSVPEMERFIEWLFSTGNSISIFCLSPWRGASPKR